MAAVKFSKQLIKPNPLEVDYWVDISSNPYGGRIMYHNGVDWVDLLNAKGKPVNMDAYYNKLQINQMLAEKASVDSVESKVDDSEIDEVIKNIEFKDRGDGGIEMVILKYDDTTVGVTMPIASNTTSGIVTKESFKDFVKQNLLQQLYSIFYTTVASIRAQYQPRLSAGKNIMIDRTTNTIHATGKISTDWNDLTNVPDFDGMFDDVNDAISAEETRAKTEEQKLSARITDHVDVVRAELDLKADKKDMYTKDQVDEKVASVYKVKGSSTFEDLPTEGNTIGDVYNITNDFVLNDIEYPFGTNLVWTENGWDTLSGVFDTTELEGLIDAVDNKVDSEILRAKNAELYIQTQLDNEITRSTEADATITSSISNAITTVKAYTDTKVYEETTRATNAEEVLRNTISTETSNREASEAVLQSNIDIVDGKLVNYILKKSVGDLDIISTNAHAVFNLHANATNICGVRFYANGLYGGGIWTDTENQTIYIQNNLISSQILGTGPYGPYYRDSRTNLLLHEGNYSNYALPLSGGTMSTTDVVTNLNADMLDGQEGSYYTPLFNATPINLTTSDDLNNIYSGFYAYRDAKNPENAISDNCAVFAFKNTRVLDAFQVAMSANDCKRNIEFIYARGIMSGNVEGNTWSDWKTIAFTDSDITGNAATATKLSTPVKLWGNDFDGSSDVDGTITFPGAGTGAKILFANGEYIDGYGNVTLPTSSNVWSVMGESHGLSVVGNGNVGIGTTNPSYKLDVNGTGFFKDKVIVENDKSLLFNNSSGTPLSALFLNTSNLLTLGYGTSSAGFTTALDGYKLWIRTGNNHAQAMAVNESGNVTIGSSDLASTNHKLYVDGKTNISDSLSVTNQITSGELVDWYGVSWSEDSSDPTCTRIGNMALHRSLPILSAMKGYYIANSQSTTPEVILPLTDDWSGSEYGNQANDSVTMDYLSLGSVMVKIPEFWYIDDYEPSTRTHNLKISQTAKAGWLHHKEAYVGAYEGYNDGTYYRSSKGVTPTVSVSRTTLRPLARANGYEDEYKWNIYTYEEHRAICHLFLVEYATRNSQLAVNTELTDDGFKQGGLGSGCTTGTVTINGVTTYSFIPTGTTDSLDNGSGQVAYTVTQTDADGNETGTVTRYANRYRGIENPFGHIWKHVDDVITQYNADTTYRTAYKCNKPDQFATNKNTKYKPLCTFPGNLQGWKKEIKATINCDFFPMATGGGETTYWSDYCWDNTDTTEHCLLIGGDSGHGGRAGLFCFYLPDGVGTSGATLGSRLTYLPWAE